MTLRADAPCTEGELRGIDSPKRREPVGARIATASRGGVGRTPCIRRSALAIVGATAMLAAILLGSPRVACAQVSREALASARARLSVIIAKAGRRDPIASPSIHIHKQGRRLDLCDGGIVVKTYAVALGSTPKGAKTKSGDRRTPEGKYFVCSRNGTSKYHLFLGVSYPNAADADAARIAGRINAATAARLATAESARQKPDWYTPLGGAVGIHGGGTFLDWTWGCIALSDKDIEELWIACPVGTPIVIDP